MRGFAILSIGCLLLFFVFHSIFIVLDYAYYNPDSGALLKMSEVFNETLSDTYRNLTWNNSVMFRQAFGIGRFVVLGLCLVFFVVGVAEEYESYRTRGKER